MDDKPVVEFLVSEGAGVLKRSSRPRTEEWFPFEAAYRRKSGLSGPMSLDGLMGHIENITRQQRRAAARKGLPLA